MKTYFGEYGSFKLVLLGAGASGKSAMTVKLVQGIYLGDDYDPTIEDSYRKQMDINNISIKYDILDTAGTPQFIALLPTWIQSGQFFLILFPVDSKRMYEYAKECITKIIQEKKENKIKRKKK